MRLTNHSNFFRLFFFRFAPHEFVRSVYGSFTVPRLVRISSVAILNFVFETYFLYFHGESTQTFKNIFYIFLVDFSFNSKSSPPSNCTMLRCPIVRSKESTKSTYFRFNDKNLWSMCCFSFVAGFHIVVSILCKKSLVAFLLNQKFRLIASQ